MSQIYLILNIDNAIPSDVRVLDIAGLHLATTKQLPGVVIDFVLALEKAFSEIAPVGVQRPSGSVLVVVFVHLIPAYRLRIVNHAYKADGVMDVTDFVVYIDGEVDPGTLVIIVIQPGQKTSVCRTDEVGREDRCRSTGQQAVYPLVEIVGIQ